GGVTAIEITMSVPRAFQMIEEVARRLGDVALVGAGSVLDAETARLVIEAGARYVVSPVFKPEIIQTAHRYDVPALPGAFTPTEILAAHEAGADIVKVFPADVVGMAFFKAIKAPMPQLKLMPTGGVTLTNAGEWLRAGACAVGVGSALLDRAAIAEGRWEKLTENARTLMESIRQARAQ
ncbi:bifunctional 4-hydroxy-2-oxoglutarate aldolase/2-dehydro-3-deoxy-phosphogluconate aldolase, partial [Rhodothermus marinus]|uniref:bifunctional 4-hydroxy-2-oxoglutarate aldolase/2-dehydro-3-deoxy-phosphogluconate aldolase n=1 Tax=Rhodothermus marinus TaxID=29549 RepID=UPI0006D1C63E